jgi:hypothetical protein
MWTEHPLQVAAAALSTGSAVAAGSLAGASIEWLGVPIQVLLAGLSGAMLALSFLPAMRLVQMPVAVISGTLAASAATPIAAYMLSLPPGLHIGVAFFAGLLAQLMIDWAFVRLPAIVEKKLGGGQ